MGAAHHLVIVEKNANGSFTMTIITTLPPAIFLEHQKQKPCPPQQTPLTYQHRLKNPRPGSPQAINLFFGLSLT